MKFSKFVSALLLILISNIVLGQVKFEAKLDIKDYNDQVFIVTELEKTNFKATDSIVVNYKLYVSQNVGINNWQQVKALNSKQFEVNELEVDKPLNIVNENYKGEKFRTVNLKKVYLKPKSNGDAAIPEYILDLQISVPSKTKKNAYGRFEMENRDITISTDKIKLSID